MAIFNAISANAAFDLGGGLPFHDKDGNVVPCPSGDKCKEEYPYAPHCYEGLCQALNPTPNVAFTTIEFLSPTGTATFADLICQTTSFVSDTILPPIAVLMMLVAGYLFLTSGGAPQRAGLAQKALLFTAAGVAVLLLAPGIVTLIGDLFNNASLKTAPACASAVTTSVIVTSFLKLINWFSWLIAVTSVAMGLYSGFLYITARDNPQQIQQAAKVLSYVIIGVAVSILAFSIIAIVKQFMGLI